MEAKKILIFLLFLSGVAQAAPVRYVVNQAEVTFVSKAPLEDVVGKSKNLSGWILMDGDRQNRGQASK